MVPEEIAKLVSDRRAAGERRRATLAGSRMSPEQVEALPRLPRFSSVYMFGLLLMVGLFYVVVLASVVFTVGLLALAIVAFGLMVVKLSYLGIKLIPLLLPVLGGIAVFGLGLIRGLFVRVGGEPTGIRCNRIDHDAIYKLTDDVALALNAKPIDRIYLTTGTEMGVFEEAAIWMPPGLGRRSLVLGMAMLDRMTLDQLRSVLAHEYGHFSARDTYFSRFLGRVHSGFGAIIGALAADQWRFLNPVYWVLWGYYMAFAWATAFHSRIREFHADRCAVELYGKRLYEESLIVAHVESSYFGGIWLPKLATGARAHQVSSNVYRDVAMARAEIHAAQGCDGMLGLLATMYEEPPSRFDSHPKIVQRFKMQAVDGGNSSVPPPTRVTLSKKDLATLPPAKVAMYVQGPPSAAAELLGPDLLRTQQKLTKVLGEELRQMMTLSRMAYNLQH